MRGDARRGLVFLGHHLRGSAHRFPHITFTAGFEPAGSGRKWGVPKSLLVSTLDAKLHCGELRFARELLAAVALWDELENFQSHVSRTGSCCSSIAPGGPMT